MPDRHANEGARFSHRSPPRYSDHSTRAPNGTFRENNASEIRIRRRSPSPVRRRSTSADRKEERRPIREQHSPSSVKSASSNDSLYFTPCNSPPPLSKSPSILCNDTLPAPPSPPSPPPPYSAVDPTNHGHRTTSTQEQQSLSTDGLFSPRPINFNENRRPTKMPSYLFDTLPRRARVSVCGPMADQTKRSADEMDDDWNSLIQHSPALRRKVRACFATPLPIQKPGIAAIQKGTDVIVRAPSGYGRTTTWMIPVMDALVNSRKCPGVLNCLVVAPTPSQVNTIAVQLKLLLPRDECDRPLISSEWFFDESKIDEYFSRLQCNGAIIAIITSKMISSLLAKAPIDFERLQYVVFDELDRKIPSECIVVLKAAALVCSSTEAEIRRAQFVIVSTHHDTAQQPEQFVGERFVEVRADYVNEEVVAPQHFSSLVDAEDAAWELLKKGPSPIAVFFEKDETVLQMKNWLDGNNIRRVGRLLPLMDNHETRYRELSAFREGKVDVFLTTYEDERLVDTDRLALDVFFELPTNFHRYTNRVARNGRVRSGRSITFICPGDLGMIPALKKARLERGISIDELRKIEENLLNQKNRLFNRHNRAAKKEQLLKQLEALEIADQDDQMAERQARDNMRAHNLQIRKMICEGR